MTINTSNSRALGVGERIEAGHYVRPAGTDDDFIPVNPWDECCGELVTEDDMLEYRQLIEAVAGTSIDGLEEALGLETEMGKRALAIALENVKLLDRKQRDYGSGNISSFGEYGVLVRCTDKLARLRNLLTNVSDPKNESIIDSWVDLSNYSLIAILCRNGQWK